METNDRRVQFDFEVDFSNGGGIQGQGFRLDIEGDDISDQDLAEYIIKDLRLLMVASVRILNKKILRERHKRAGQPMAETFSKGGPELIDLSHTIVNGMVTYRGLPAPLICDFLSREASEAQYGGCAAFQIGRIDMVANTGTYLDSPFHRFADGKDLSELDLKCLAGLDTVVVCVAGAASRAIDRYAFGAMELRGKAILVHTGWAEHWGSEQYFEGHPFLTASAAVYLRDHGAALVGIDSLNIDDTNDLSRPVHTTLLGAGIPIVEHLRGLEHLPVSGCLFTAAPVKVKAMGTFPVRAFAAIPSVPVA